MSGSVGDNTARASGVIASAGGGGKILQVVQQVKTNTSSYAGTTWKIISGFSKAITPVAEGSSFLVSWNLTIGYSRNMPSVFLDIDGAGYNQLTDYIGNAAGSRGRTNAMSDGPETRSSNNILDTPTYSLGDVLTYDVRFFTHGSHTAYVNRTQADADNYYTVRGASFVTIWEIAA